MKRIATPCSWAKCSSALTNATIMMRAVRIAVTNGAKQRSVQQGCAPAEPRQVRVEECSRSIAFGDAVNELGPIDHAVDSGNQHRDEGRHCAKEEGRSRHIGDDATELVDRRRHREQLNYVLHVWPPHRSSSISARACFRLSIGRGPESPFQFYALCITAGMSARIESAQSDRAFSHQLACGIPLSCRTAPPASGQR